MADLFLSYSPQDAQTALQIAQELERRGSEIFYQRPETISPQDSEKLDHEMGQASWVIVLWSGNALQDGRITYEAMYARDKNNLLSVQIEPNSIPAEYNNAQSPDHTSYQDQLSSIIQQTLWPEQVQTETAGVQATVAETQAGTAVETGQVPATTPQTGSFENQSPAVTGQDGANITQTAGMAAPSGQLQQQATQGQHEPAGQAAAGQVAATQGQQPPGVPLQQATGSSPRQVLQERLAEQTQASVPGKTIPPANTIGQPPASNTPPPQAGTQAAGQQPNIPQQQNTGQVLGNSQTRSLPPLPGKSQAAAPPPRQDTPVPDHQMMAPPVASGSGKLVPIALMSAGILLLGSVGAGYWYLASTPANVAMANGDGMAKTRMVRKNPAPVKVAANKVARPGMTDSGTAGAPDNSSREVSTEDDPLLSQILQGIPVQKAVAKGNETSPETMVFKASATRGAKSSVSQCSGCHSFKRKGKNMAGPNLYGVMNQLIGSERRYSYSDTLRSMGAIGEVWNREQLDCYLKDPTVCMPGTKMGFGGIRSHKKRADIIAYLGSLKER